MKWNVWLALAAPWTLTHASILPTLDALMEQRPTPPFVAALGAYVAPYKAMEEAKAKRRLKRDLDREREAISAWFSAQLATCADADPATMHGLMCAALTRAEAEKAAKAARAEAEKAAKSVELDAPSEEAGTTAEEVVDLDAECAAEEEGCRE